MHRLLWTTLAALVLQVAHAVTIPELSSSDFESTIGQGVWFVEFFSPYCPHCRAFAPTWQQLADEHEALASTKDFHFAKVDCTLSGDICKAQGIRAFPTLHLYAQGNLIEMVPHKERTYDKLNEYIPQQADTYGTGGSGISKDGMQQQEEESISTSMTMANADGVSVDMDRTALEAAKASGRPWFIKFYAPWCGFCKKLAPAWVEMAKDLKHQVDVGEVNCDEHLDLCVENGVKGYPTLKLFVSGTDNDYHDDRSLVSLVNFARKFAGPSVKHVNGAQLERYIQDETVSLVYLYDKKEEDATNLLERVAESFPDGPSFYVANDPQAIRQFSLAPADLPTVLIVKDGKHIMYPSHTFANTDTVQQALSKWIGDERFPLVSEIGPGNAPEILQGERMVVLGVIKQQDQASLDQFRSIAERYAKQQKASSSSSSSENRVLFATLEGNMWSDYARSAYRVHPNRLPAIVIVDPVHARFYNHDHQGKLFSLSEADTILQAVKKDIPEQKLVGVSTLPLHERMGQTLQHGVGLLRAHWLLTGVALSALLYIFAKRMHLVSPRRSHLLPVKQGPRDD
ncbi:thioredoxin-like protein [Lichtheimia hyalospora FSU 10163]|nr:thioredoxin-like protein [Lichtheimia hyalospora FSU 10163]